jgi:hypothetical protein
MARECRRIVLRWLDGATPCIGAAEALAVLDAERWAGIGRWGEEPTAGLMGDVRWCSMYQAESLS